MSLGWQSESALLPSKATPINVDSKSMMSMKALVYKIEQKLSSEGASQDGVYKRKLSRGSSSNLIDKRSSKVDLKKDAVHREAKKKEKELDNLESEKIEDRVTASLRAKAAIYDQIILGNGRDRQLQTNSATSGSGPFLINFADKKMKFDDNNDNHYDYDQEERDTKIPKYGSVSYNNDKNNGTIGTGSCRSSSSIERNEGSRTSITSTSSGYNKNNYQVCHTYLRMMT